MTKRQQYDRVINQIGAFPQPHCQRVIEDAKIWEQIVIFDDWLAKYREDDRVMEIQYQRVCDRLVALFGGT